MDVFDLAAKLTLDSSEYESGLGKAENTAGSFGDKLSKGIGNAAKIGAAAIGAVTAATAAMGAAITKSISATAEYGDEIDKTSQKLGLSSTAYQEWDFVLNHAGTSMANMGTGLKTLTNKLDDAKNGSKSAQDMFAQLGLSMDELNNMSREEVFAATITGFQGMADSTERAALANDLFGKSGQELTPLFNTSVQETQEMIKSVNELGGVMSEDAVKASATFEDSLQDLQTAFTGAKNNMASEFLPAVTEVMDGLTALFSGDSEGIGSIESGILSMAEKANEAIPKISAAFEQMMPTIVQVITESAPILASAALSIIEGLAKGISDNLPAIMDSAMKIITTITTELVNMLPEIIKMGMELILQLAVGIAEALPDLIPTIVDTVLMIVDTLLDNIDLLIDAAIQLMIGLAEGLIKALPKIIDKVPTIVIKLARAFITNAPKILDAAVQLIATLASGLIDNLPKIRDAAFELILKLGEWVIEKAGELKDKAVEIIDKLKAGLLDGITKIKDVGKDLISGLWNGIKEKWDALKQKVEEFGEGIVNKFKDVFGIHSPSRVFAEIGRYMAMGLDKGWTDESKRVLEGINDDLQFSANIDNVRNVTPATSDDYIGGLDVKTLGTVISNAVANALESYEIEWDDRNLGRMVKKYA